MFTAKIKIRGISPMLQNKCNLIGTKGLGDKGYEDEWLLGTYCNSKGEVECPERLLTACLYEASKSEKIGKYFMTKLVPTGVIIQEFDIPMFFKGKQITIDDIRANDWILTCPVVIGKSRVNKSRTMLPIGWEMNFTVSVEDDLIKKDSLKYLIEKAGKKAGVGDWRPSARKPGRFGRFELVKMDVV